jgi:hypothetical protein
VPDDEGQLALDQLLVGSLFNKKEPQAAGNAHPRADVLHRLLGKLLLFTHVVRPTETVCAAAEQLWSHDSGSDCRSDPDHCLEAWLRTTQVS